MSKSHPDGRNQKLVIDYLEALLEDAEDNNQLINVVDEVASTRVIEAIAEPVKTAEIEAPVAIQEPIEEATATEEPAAIEEPAEMQEPIEEPTEIQESIEEPTEMQESIEEPTAIEEPTEMQEPIKETAATEDTVEQGEEAVIAKSTLAHDESLKVDEPRVSEPTELSINCIIVNMYGLKLAIPFEDIEGLIKLSNVTLSLDNDRSWILGDFTSATMRTHIVDTAQILFGDNYDPLKSNYNEMLVLAGKHWSIVFDKVIKAQNILLSDVTENASPQFRPWLTGTHLPEKCALVNVPAMVKMFEEELNANLGG